MTIIVKPLTRPTEDEPDPFTTQCEVYAIMEDQTVLLPTTYSCLAEFAMLALANGWRDKYRCIIVPRYPLKPKDKS